MASPAAEVAASTRYGIRYTDPGGAPRVHLAAGPEQAHIEAADHRKIQRDNRRHRGREPDAQAVCSHVLPWQALGEPPSSREVPDA